MEIGQVSPVYLFDMSQFQKILQQRNHYLKRLQINRKTDDPFLNVLTEQYIEVAIKVIKNAMNLSGCWKIGLSQFTPVFLVDWNHWKFTINHRLMYRKARTGQRW
ncbi:hypothetical protein ACI2OX_21985 [Bacillus sp. N9]